MKSVEHKKHLNTNVSWNNCQECRADNERRFIHPRWVGYRLVHEYLEFAKAGFGNKGVRTWWGGDRLTAEEWSREFRKALHRRIYLRVEPPKGRKFCDSYVERLKQFVNRGIHAERGKKHSAEAAYLRLFAQKGACTL